MNDMSPLVNAERLKEIVRLDVGGHAPGAAMCAMEAAAYIAGEPWSRHPRCVCPVIASFMRIWNDRSSDGIRNEIILPLVPKIIGSTVSRATQERRVYACADSAVRVFAPAALRAAGLNEPAARLEALPEVTRETAADAADAAAFAAYAAAAAAAAAFNAAADAAFNAAAAADAAGASSSSLVLRLLAITDEGLAA